MESISSPGVHDSADSVITAVWHRALAIGLSPVTVSQLFDFNSPQPPLPPPMYGPFPYYPYYQSSYGTYLPHNGMSEGEASAQSDHHMLGHSQQMQQPMDQFQYPQVAPPWATHSPYPSPAPYVYPPVNAEASPDTTVTVEVEALSIKETTTTTVSENQ